MSCKYEPYYSTYTLKFASITNFLTHDAIVNATMICQTIVPLTIVNMLVTWILVTITKLATTTNTYISLEQQKYLLYKIAVTKMLL